MIKFTDGTNTEYDWCQVNGRNDSCFLKGTLITLADGTQKPVEDITYDDELLVWNFDQRHLDHAKPLWIKMPQTCGYYFHTHYSNGTDLYTTGKSDTGWGHRAYDMRHNKFRYVYECVGDDVKTQDGSARCMSSQLVQGECKFYNIITERHFNCFANGILTSCSLNNLYEMKDMKFVKDGREESTVDYSQFPERYVEGLRLKDQPGDKREYVKNLLELDAEMHLRNMFG